MTTSPNGRLNFSKTTSTVPLPNLIQVQRGSYEDFLQMDLDGAFAGLSLRF